MRALFRSLRLSREYCNRSLNENVALLHFIKEGDDCFYVTGCTSNGNEVGGYEANRATSYRFMTRVLPYTHLPQIIPAELLPALNELDEIHIEANRMRFTCNVPHQELVLKLGTIVYELLGNTWNTLVETLGPEVGTICVLPKNRGNIMWLEAFNNDGSMITDVVFKGAATLRREQLQLQLTNFEKRDDRMKHVCFWPFHMDHFGETDSTFYKTFAHIHSQNRLAIPAKFIKTPNATYEKALIIHQEY